MEKTNLEGLIDAPRAQTCQVWFSSSAKNIMIAVLIADDQSMVRNYFSQGFSGGGTG
jgi:hypothetical protein